MWNEGKQSNDEVVKGGHLRIFSAYDPINICVQ